MKTKSNKKVVDAVRKFVAGAAAGAKRLEKKGASLMKKVEGAWDSTQPRRDTITASVKRVADRAEKKASEFAKSATQVKDDIAMGMRQGIKDAKKK